VSRRSSTDIDVTAPLPPKAGEKLSKKLALDEEISAGDLFAVTPHGTRLLRPTASDLEAHRLMINVSGLGSERAMSTPPRMQ
jgi:hypothetical protein